MLDLARDVNALLARRLRAVLKLPNFFVHIALEVRDIAHRIDTHRTEPVRGHTARVRRAFFYTKGLTEHAAAQHAGQDFGQRTQSVPFVTAAVYTQPAKRQERSVKLCFVRI